MEAKLQEDRLLVRRMLDGEEEAFEEFFKLFFPGLYRFALARLRQDSTAAEEVVQRTLCKAVTKLSLYRGEAALFTWLCTFCRHEICNFLKCEPELVDSPEVMAALESLLVSEEDRPDQALMRKEVAQVVQFALDALPAHYADALEWKYIEGLSVKEIAGRLDLGLKAAESLLTRARQAFRDAFHSQASGVAWGTESGG